MHMVIRTIVYAKDKDEALDEARHVFERLVEREKFDYYTMFDNEGTSVSGKGRWGELTPVAEVDSKKGKQLINEGMKYTQEHFNEAIKYVREALDKHTDKELFEDRTVKVNGMTRMFKYYCSVMGSYDGPNVWLYDNDGEGITDHEHLKDVLSKWQSIYDRENKPNPHKDMKIWVVPADVHY